MWRPRKDRVIVRLWKAPAVTEGGIALPEQAQQSAQQPIGTVISTGPDVTDLAKGDFVMMVGYKMRYLPPVGTATKDTYIIIREQDIECVREQEAA